MFHEPAGGDNQRDLASGYKSKLGVQMFIVYALVYAVFVAINLAKPTMMEAVVGFGLNLAIAYGFGLIGLALILAVIYNAMCVRVERKLEGDAPAKRAEP
jgi:uncharacterized membrane protein (DUF485 family)